MMDTLSIVFNLIIVRNEDCFGFLHSEDQFNPLQTRFTTHRLDLLLQNWPIFDKCGVAISIEPVYEDFFHLCPHEFCLKVFYHFRKGLVSAQLKDHRIGLPFLEVKFFRLLGTLPLLIYSTVHAAFSLVFPVLYFEWFSFMSLGKFKNPTFGEFYWLCLSTSKNNGYWIISLISTFIIYFISWYPWDNQFLSWVIVLLLPLRSV